MHTRKPTPVLIVKGNRTGNYGVPKVDEKRLKMDMVPYASAVGRSIYCLDTVHISGLFWQCPVHIYTTGMESKITASC